MIKRRRLALVRWLMIAFCLLIIVPLIRARDGYGEYLRGATATTAHLHSCIKDYDMQEQAHITCTATWRANSTTVDGTVAGLDSVHWPTVSDPKTPPFGLQIPADQVEQRVFAEGSQAHLQDRNVMTATIVFAVATVLLLVWWILAALQRVMHRGRAGGVAAHTDEDGIEPSRARMW